MARPQTLMAGATQTRPRSSQTCPNCGAEADPGQLVCLECGGRLALDYRRPAGGKRAAAVVLAVLAAAGVAFAVTLASVDDGAEEEIGATPASKPANEDARDTTNTEATTSTTDEQAGDNAEERARARRERAAERRRAERRRAAQRRAERRRAAAGGGIASWPPGRDGFMVVLMSTQDRNGARDFARTRRRAGVDGVLRADDYPSLSASAGFYIVFAGPYSSRLSAERAAGRLSGRFTGAFVQFVDGSKKR